LRLDLRVTKYKNHKKRKQVLQLINFKTQRQWIEKGKKLNATLIENKARIHYGRNNYIKDLAKDSDCSVFAIYNAFNGKAPMRLFLIDQLLKSFQNSNNNLQPVSNNNLD
jgi:hypothetical protein